MNLSKCILIFDVETTGLLRSGEAEPYITQLCLIVYDIETGQTLFEFNQYINIPQEIEIRPLITELTGVTREKCDQGVSIAHAIEVFHRECQVCDIIVAHNVRFDRAMMLLEINRNKDKFDCDISNLFDHKILHCTMMVGIDVCNLWTQGKKKQYKKFPKLSELHETLFGSLPVGRLHDALVDTQACLKCYIELRDKNHIK